MTNGPAPVITSLNTRTRVGIVLNADDALIDEHMAARQGDFRRWRDTLPPRSPEWALEKAMQGLWQANLNWEKVRAYRGTGIPPGTVALLVAARITPDEAARLDNLDQDNLLALIALKKTPERTRR